MPTRASTDPAPPTNNGTPPPGKTVPELPTITPAPRLRRRPKLIALAVALIALGGALSAYIWTANSDAVSVVAISRSVQRGQAPSSFTVDLVDGNAMAADLAVLVSVSENTVPAFQASKGLGPFRGIVRATAPDGHPHLFDSPGHAVDLAQAVVRTIRSARSRYGTIGAVHLFIAGPVGLAFLIGQLLNTLGAVTTYEHVSASGTGAYARAAVLAPSH